MNHTLQNPKSGRFSFRKLIVDVILTVFGILMILPLIMLTANAFKTPAELLAWPPRLIPQSPTLDNFSSVITETPLLIWMGNSLAFAAISTVAIVLTSSITGYVLAKFRFPGVNLIFFGVLATAIVPFEVYMIPLYLGVRQLGLLNSLGGLLAGYLVMSFGIFLVRQYAISSIPDELMEAARMDGAGEWWIFFRIVLPLMRGPIGTLTVLAFFQAWTTFAWPMVVNTARDKYVLEVGLALFQTGFTVDLGRLSAAAALSLIPSVIFFGAMRRNFVKGVAASGMKE
ncbi:carbohydrate ABC transporter permease [Agrobacterium tumefaciens]|uniref:carbohydrate ABC transporter permease n=1 Tax=Rhizobium/Agrobacterium group TaxID=227290 RepID=UPI000ED0A7D9|nr:MULTISPECIES: carbohydrate ABC transporter permease [Rhizobium/Agrobacterium group]WKL19455.1 carbohydrate ABC transporter permease [Agrobacterium tumefaciens]HCJ72632.1 carbohydrate ABC transporter permease [Agrobacterium sp.]MDH0116924.1 carbohydrate ABC transporter permease [Agrobacterium pusense]MDH2090597.1 carbohydrate ABC transporter permease [Agrobacterium pusense]RSC36586.1 carbohydrate ABC transporter permease [Agrobacterium sp. FDAARGOS_525]